MNVKEKYNKIIYTIEELAKGEKIEDTIVPVSDHDISDIAFESADSSTMNDQSKNVLFLFLNNCTVIDYINERKMVAVYKMFYECKDWTKRVAANAIQMIGLSDYQAFCKKFKKYFDMSPKKAFECKETVVIPMIRDWDAISKDGRSLFVKFDEVNMIEEKFGISKEKLMVAYAAANLQSFYKLNDYESEIAFKLSKKNSLSIENTFEYIYNYVWSFVDEDSPKRDARLESDLLKPEVIYMYFDCGMSFNEIIIAMLAMNKCKLPRELKDADRLYLLGFKKFSDNILIYSAEYFTIFPMINGKVDENFYEDIYKYYKKEVLPSELDKVYLKFVDYCTNMSFKHALDRARNEDYEKKMAQHYVYESEFVEDYEDDQDEYNYGDEFLSEQEEFENDPDLDDMELAEELYMNHDHLEVFNEYNNVVEYLGFSFNEFNSFCDTLDSDDENSEKKPETNRRLMGYQNLDIVEIIKARDEENRRVHGSF